MVPLRLLEFPLTGEAAVAIVAGDSPVDFRVLLRVATIVKASFHVQMQVWGAGDSGRDTSQHTGVEALTKTPEVGNSTGL